MIKDEKLGIKISQDSDETFWEETKEKCIEGIKSAERNIKLDKKLLELCNEELDKYDK